MDSLNKLAISLGLIFLGFLTYNCSTDKKSEEKKACKPVTGKPALIKSEKVAENKNHKEANEILVLYQEFLTPYKFEDFPVKQQYLGKAAPLDLTSHIDAALFQKTLTSGLEIGSNFAGHYTLVSINCGDNCQDNYIIDTRTGKVCDKVQSKLGVSCKINSRLLILNPPDPMNIEVYEKVPEAKPEVYVLQHNLLYKAKLVK